jgi:gamma-glutamyl:cysteine ligase YbdK (ATP-grasp superfamily)
VGRSTFEVNSKIVSDGGHRTDIDDLLQELYVDYPRWMEGFETRPSFSSMPLTMPVGGFEMSKYDRWEEISKIVGESFERAGRVTGFQPNIGTFSNRNESEQVAAGLAPWAHVLEAMAAGSPFWCEDIGEVFALKDTGQHSHRATVWRGMPSTDDWEIELTRDEEEAARGKRVLVTGLDATHGDVPDISLDHARIRSHPTRIEFRNLDSPLTRDMAKMEIVLARALVQTVRRQLEAEGVVNLPMITPSDRRNAAKIAALSGVSESLFHPAEGENRPANEVIDAFFSYVRGALSEEEATFVRYGFDEILHGRSQVDLLRKQWETAQEFDILEGSAIKNKVGEAGAIWLSSYVVASQEVGGFGVPDKVVEGRAFELYDQARTLTPLATPRAMGFTRAEVGRDVSSLVR